MSDTGIAPGYASPGLRLSLYLEDHPDAEQPAYDIRRLADVDPTIPEDWGGDQEVVVCTLRRPGVADVVAWRETYETKKNGETKAVIRRPDVLVALQTKALGRALKKAGYPDHLPDLKAMMLWRQRNAENSLILTTGRPLAALGSGPVTGSRDTDLDAAAVAHPEDAGADDGGSTVAEDDVAVEVPEDYLALSPRGRQEVDGWLDERGVDFRTAPAKPLAAFLAAQDKIDAQNGQGRHAPEAGPGPVIDGGEERENVVRDEVEDHPEPEPEPADEEPAPTDGAKLAAMSLDELIATATAAPADWRDRSAEFLRDHLGTDADDVDGDAPLAVLCEKVRGRRGGKALMIAVIEAGYPF